MKPCGAKKTRNQEGFRRAICSQALTEYLDKSRVKVRGTDNANRNQSFTLTSCQRNITRRDSDTHTAVEMIANTKRGTRANIFAIVMKLVHTVYIVGALALGTVNARRTRRNLPKPPVGERMAATNPPTLLSSPNPAFHAGT